MGTRIAVLLAATAGTPAEFSAFIAAEAGRYRQLIREAGIKVDVE